MSGIAGLIRFDGGSASGGVLKNITSAMAHRAPNGIQHWMRGPVALGQCCTRTTPGASDMALPHKSEDGSVVLVIDGRLDNRDELKAALSARGARLRHVSDAEITLRAFEEWGSDFPRHLCGDFAIAIWDGRRNRLFCVRDHMGVRPFYYHVNQAGAAFASEEEAFLGLPGVSRDLNDVYMASFLAPRFYGGDDNQSCFRDVIKLPPATTLTLDLTGRADVRKYWKLEPMEPLRFSSQEECTEAFRAIFGEAVKCRMKDVEAPGLLLSGGIDSASVAAFSQRYLQAPARRKLRTFSVVTDNAEHRNEVSNIHAINQTLGTEATLVHLPGFTGPVSIKDLKRQAWDLAHPLNNSILLTGILYRAAKESGCHVVADGIEGDLTTFIPDRYMAGLLRSGPWRDAWREAGKATQHSPFLQGRLAIGTFGLSLWDAFAPWPIKRMKRRIFKARSTGFGGIDLISKAFAAQIGLQERLADQIAERERAEESGGQTEHIKALTHFGVSWSMEVFDATARRHGIDPRHPWSDLRVVEFFLRLPLNMKAHDGWTKYVVRTATAPLLEPNVVWHSGKDHLGSQLAKTLMDASQDEIAWARDHAPSLLGEYADPGQIRLLFARQTECLPEEELDQLFEVMTLAFWLRRLRAIRPI